MKTTELMNALENNKIEDVIDNIPNISFTDYIEALINKFGLKKADIIKASTIERTYGYQILKGTRNPNRNKVICLALSMKLSVDDTNRLLSLSDNGQLYPKVTRDAYIIHCIIQKLDVIATNEVLHAHNFATLE